MYSTRKRADDKLSQNASLSESSSRNEIFQGGANQEHPDNNHDDDTTYVMDAEIPHGSQDNNLCETTASGELKPQSRKSTREYVD